MEFSYNFRDIADRLLTFRNTRSTVYGNMLTLNAYKHLFKYTFDSEVTEIPVAMSFANRLTSRRVLNNCNEFLVRIDESSAEYASADTILKHMSRRIACIKYTLKSKKVTASYYGCNGAILDKNFNVLFASTYCGKFNENGIFVIDKVRAYFAKKVLTDDNDPMCRVLARKLLPYYLTREEILPSANSAFVSLHNGLVPVEVVIKTPPVEVESSDKKNLTNFSSEDVNKFLCDYKDRVFETIKFYNAVR